MTDFPETFVDPDTFLEMSPTKRLLIVLDHIDREPEAHSQAYWCVETSCGTRMCVAGWACYLAGDLAVFDQEYSRYAHRVITEDNEEVSIEHRAQSLLGLSFDQANSLFFSSDTYFRGVIDEIVAENGDA